MLMFPLPDAPPRERGRAHGEHFRRSIHDLARIRLDLALSQGGYPSEDAVLRVAGQHLPLLARYDEALSEELLGIAEGADLSPDRLVVLNHYTDLKDIDAEECSALVCDTAEGPVLAQTWDMHGSAADYVCLLEIPAYEDRPALVTFSLTGCLALAGLNSRGLGVTINNLKSRDGRVGVVWPALVRRMLAESGVEAAKHVLMTAPMSSGHHYLFADAERTCGVETSGERKAVVHEARFGQGSRDCFVHTNHCVSEEIAAVSWVSETSTSHERYAALSESVTAAPIASPQDAWARLGSHEGYPRSVCTHLASPEAPHAIATCGAVLMDLSRTAMWATQGCVHEASPEVFAPTGASTPDSAL